MLEFDIPGRGRYLLVTLVLDLNGTLTLDGKPIEGVRERIELVRKQLSLTIVTADTLGLARELGDALGVPIHRLDPGREREQKAAFVHQLGADETVSIGNGSNDVSMLEESALGICVLGPEGASAEALASSDIAVSDINLALDLLLKPARIIATLRR
jgi:P-type E1-E2 ATPase